MNKLNYHRKQYFKWREKFRINRNKTCLKQCHTHAWEYGSQLIGYNAVHVRPNYRRASDISYFLLKYDLNHDEKTN